MADHPSSDGDRADGEIPLTGPASRVYRYLPTGAPQDRAQRYFGDHDASERALRYLGGPTAGGRPSETATPAPRPPASEPRSAPAAPASGGARSALHTMVAAVLEERREVEAEPRIVPPREPEAPAPVDAPEAPTPVDAPEAPTPVEAPEAPAPDHLSRLRALADLLQTAHATPEGLHPAVELVREATGAEGVVLTLTAPRPEHLSAGAVGEGGVRHAAPVRADGATVGELTIAGPAEPGAADLVFLSLAADQFGALAARVAAGSALDPGDQRFVNVLVAEMRAPLATVAGLLEDFTRGHAGPLSEAQLGYLRVAGDHTGRLLAIVRDLQTLSGLRRPEAHECDHVGIGPLLARTAAAWRAQAEARGIELIADEPADALVVRGVSEQLDRALGAVVDNAIRFSHPSGRVLASAARVEGEVRISVADLGIGMEPAEAERAFERFFRARTAVEAGIPGVGLGLNIAREVVAVHGGRAWAESAPGEGTRVHLALPPA